MKNKILFVLVLGLGIMLAFLNINKATDNIVPSFINPNINLCNQKASIVINAQSDSWRIPGYAVFGRDSIGLYFPSMQNIDRLFYVDSVDCNHTYLRNKGSIHYSLYFSTSKYINIENNYYTMLGCGIYSPELHLPSYYFRKDKTISKNRNKSQKDELWLSLHKLSSVLHGKLINTWLYDRISTKTCKTLPQNIKLKARLSSQNLYIYIPKQSENIATIFTDPALDEPRIEMAQLIKDNLENHFKVIAENNNGKIARFNQKLTLNLDLCKFNSHEYILVAKRGKSLIQSQDLITSDTALYKYATDFISLYKEINPGFKDLYNNPEGMYE